MRHQTLVKAVLFCSLVLLVMLPVRASAQPPRRGGLYGDWQITVQFGERQMESILSFSRNQERNLTGQWISFWGVGELQDVKFEENKLSFVQVYQFGENEFRSDFTGTIEEGKLSGTLSSDRGESKVEGKRSPRMSRAVGNWEMTYKIGDRDITGTLVVKPDKEGQLTAEWQSQRGEHQISDLAYSRGKLTFRRTSKFQDQQRESNFEGTIQRGALSGVFKSERGDITVEGTQIGAALIGTWNLDVTGERGTRKQRLLVNPDMSALYGATALKKVGFQGDQVSFKIVREFGDQTFEMNFKGKLEDTKLTGEITTSRGTQKVAGTKVIRTFRRRTTQ